MLSSLCLLLFFILMQGVFAGLETGMISIRRPRIEHACEQGSRAARMILFFINRPGVMISTCLLGVNISVVCASLSAKRLSGRGETTNQFLCRRASPLGSAGS